MYFIIKNVHTRKQNINVVDVSLVLSVRCHMLNSCIALTASFINRFTTSHLKRKHWKNDSALVQTQLESTKTENTVQNKMPRNNKQLCVLNILKDVKKDRYFFKCHLCQDHGKPKREASEDARERERTRGNTH